MTAVAILDVGKEVLSCSRDGTAIKWSNPEDKILKKWNFEAGPCSAICVGADHISSWFAVACEGKKVFVEDANESEVRDTLALILPSSDLYLFHRRSPDDSCL